MAFAQGSEHIGSLAATTAGAASTFSVKASSVLIKNFGTNTVYASLATTSGTTDGWPLASGDSVTMSPNSGYWSGLSVVTSTSTGAGPTATVRFWAIP